MCEQFHEKCRELTALLVSFRSDLRGRLWTSRQSSVDEIDQAVRGLMNAAKMAGLDPELGEVLGACGHGQRGIVETLDEPMFDQCIDLGLPRLTTSTELLPGHAFRPSR
jgi:hypothetical protein